MAGTLAGIEVREGNERGRQEGENICIRNRWEGDMGSSRHESPPHQARAYLVVSNDAVCIFSYGYQTVQWSEKERVRDGLISPYVS